MHPVSSLLLVPSCHTVATYSLGWVSRKHPNTETIFVPLWAANTESLFGKLEPACSQDPFHLSRRTTGGERGDTERGCWRAWSVWIQTHTHTHTHTPAVFLMASRWQLHWLRKEFCLYVRLWENYRTTHLIYHLSEMFPDIFMVLISSRRVKKRFSIRIPSWSPPSRPNTVSGSKKQDGDMML